jgi:hypothetical protein
MYQGDRRQCRQGYVLFVFGLDKGTCLQLMLGFGCRMLHRLLPWVLLLPAVGGFGMKAPPIRRHLVLMQSERPSDEKGAGPSQVERRRAQRARDSRQQQELSRWVIPLGADMIPLWR